MRPVAALCADPDHQAPNPIRTFTIFKHLELVIVERAESVTCLGIRPVVRGQNEDRPRFRPCCSRSRQRRVAGVDVEPAEEGGQRGQDRAERTVLDLEREAQPVGRGGAEEALGAALRDPAVEPPDESAVGRDRPAQQVGTGTHRGDDALRNVTSPGSPAAATIRPSRTATACTRCLASTTPPRVATTEIGSATSRVYGAGAPDPVVGAIIRACRSCPRSRRGCGSSTRSCRARRSRPRGPLTSRR